jgi:hypothetical protein
MLASIAVIVAALYLAKAVLVPITLAVLLSFLLSPVGTGSSDTGRPRPGCGDNGTVGFMVLGGADTWFKCRTFPGCPNTKPI